MKYKAFLFDNDGTITDSNSLIVSSFRYMSRTVIGRELELPEICASFGRPLDEIMMDFKAKYQLKESIEEMCDIYRTFQKTHSDSGIPAFPDIPKTLAALKEKGVKLGVVTSRLNDSTISVLSQVDIYKYFDVLIGANDTNIHKPQPEPALLCCERLGVDPSEALMIGDAVFDIQCGQNAGCSTCFVGWSFCTTKEQALAAHPDYIVNTPMDLLELV